MTPTPPIVRIDYSNGVSIECPVKYLGFRKPTEEDKREYHCWRVLNEGPYDSRNGDEMVVLKYGPLPQCIECLGTGDVDPSAQEEKPCRSSI